MTLSDRSVTEGEGLCVASASVRPEPSGVEVAANAMKKHLRISIDQDWEGMKYAILGIDEAAHEIASLAAPALQPVQPLLAARFKLSFNSKGNCETLRAYASQLAGKWVWLVEATDGKNMPLFTSSAPVGSGRSLADANSKDRELAEPREASGTLQRFAERLEARAESLTLSRDEALEALRVERERVGELEEALRPFARLMSDIPDELPDSLWTECSTYDYDMPAEMYEALIARGVPLKDRKTSLTLWFDGHPIGDFRRARSVLAQGGRG